jgi:hypothetical protein
MRGLPSQNSNLAGGAQQCIAQSSALLGQALGTKAMRSQSSRLSTAAIFWQGCGGTSKRKLNSAKRQAFVGAEFDWWNFTIELAFA